MRIFLTGATGYIGSAVLDVLLRGGHEITASVRDPEKAEHLKLRGVNAVVADLAGPSRYVAAAEACDSIIHTAFESSKRGAEVDRAAVEALLGAAIKHSAKGHPTSFVYTSGVWVLGDTAGAADEDAILYPPPLVAWRPEIEKLVLDAGRGRTLRTAVIRPGIVYGGARGIVGDLLKQAANSLVRVVGDGRNRWPCVYDRDLADLYLRVATRAEASGIFHATDEADERVADIVEAIARNAKTPADIRNVPLEEARAKMGPVADALAMNQIVRSPRARAIGWAPSLHSVSGNVARLFEEFRTAREAA
jgi:nucleoside-diphosphate-sugar epimerase